MPAATREEANEQQRRWYAANKRQHIAAVRAYQAKTKAWFQEIKKNSACVVCGESEFSCIDFHHVNPVTKNFAIYDGLRKRMGRPTLERELAKCVTLCANCHRKLHAGVIQLSI